MECKSLFIGHVGRQHRWFLRSSVHAFACAPLTAPAISQNASSNPEQQQSAETQTYGVTAWRLTNSDLPANPSVRFCVLPNDITAQAKQYLDPADVLEIRVVPKPDVGGLSVQ